MAPTRSTLTAPKLHASTRDMPPTRYCYEVPIAVTSRDVRRSVWKIYDRLADDSPTQDNAGGFFCNTRRWLSVFREFRRATGHENIAAIREPCARSAAVCRAATQRGEPARWVPLPRSNWELICDVILSVGWSDALDSKFFAESRASNHTVADFQSRIFPFLAMNW